jgi:hypothetical protein
LGIDWAHLPWLVCLPSVIGALAGLLCVVVWLHPRATVAGVVAAGAATAGFAVGSAGLLWVCQEGFYRFLPAWPWDVANWMPVQWGLYAMGPIIFLAALLASVLRRRNG